MEKIEESEFGSGIEKDDRIKIGIQKPAAVREHWSDYVGRKQSFKHHANKRR